jgi:hypothetical protein
MLRKSIIAIAAAATLASLASTPASARWGGWGHHFGGFHHAYFFRHSIAFHHPYFFRHRVAFHHPFFFHRHVAFVGGPIFIGDGCWTVQRVPTFWGWRWRRVWLCG